MHNVSRFSRTKLLVGSAEFDRVRNSHVLICGIGGVGSHAAEALGRAGVGRITLIDGDVICSTNINRQIHALTSTVGQPKVEVMANRLRDINPDAQITPIEQYFSGENAVTLLASRPDYVLDAIDNFTAKAALITLCREQGHQVISSMGAANKLDPTKIRVDDISVTRNCRMARSMRKILRSQGVNTGVAVVYSIEEHRELEVAEITSSAGYHRVTLGSISYIPAMFGLMMAGVVVNDLLAAKD